MPHPPALPDGLPELRRGLLAVCVLDDIDLLPGTDGVLLTGPPQVLVSWEECRTALAGVDPELPAGRRRLVNLLRTRLRCAALGPAVAVRLRPVGLPADHALHPGPDWVRERVLGGALELGLGVVDLDPAAPDLVVPVPTAALAHAGLDPDGQWAAARDCLERMGAVAAALLARDGTGRLRPVGDCDVLTLLGSRALRLALTGPVGGMVAAVVPMRRRGWTDLGVVDPAFGPAAAAATDPEDRGFARPLLLTADEVTQVPAGGRAERIVLLDPAAERPGQRPVLYR